MIDSPPEPRIRRAASGDVDALVALENACFRGVYAAHRWSRDQFRYYLGNDQAVVLVAEVAGRRVGYAAGILSQGRLAHLARLHSIAVDAAHRGSRAATRLLDRFLAEARRHGRREVVLEVSSTRRPARALFTRAGFSPSRRIPDYYGAEHDALRMRKSLDAA